MHLLSTDLPSRDTHASRFLFFFQFYGFVFDVVSYTLVTFTNFCRTTVRRLSYSQTARLTDQAAAHNDGRLIQQPINDMNHSIGCP